MRKLNLNSRFLLAFLAGKTLFLFLLFPLLVYAADKEGTPKSDSLSYRSSSAMYITEGTIVYNENNISIYQENKTGHTEKTYKKRNKNLAVSKAVAKKRGKIYHYTKRHTSKTKFRAMPIDSDSFFSKTAAKDNIVLPATQQLKITVITSQNILLVFNNYNNVYSLDGLQKFTNDHHSQKLQIRPPPFFI